MTHFWSLRRSVVFAILFSAALAHAQQPLTWEDNVLRAVEAIRTGRYPAARQFMLAAQEQSRPFAANDIRRAQTHGVLATVCQLQGDMRQAEALYMQTRALLEAIGEAGQSYLAQILDSLGQLYFDEGRWVESEEILKQSQ